MKPATLLLLAALLLAAPLRSAEPAPKPFPLSPEWTAKIRDLAPARPRVAPKASRRALLFSLSTGFQHWATPHTAAVMTALAEKSGACQIVASEDIDMFAADTLRGFDAVILNNNCSDGKQRDLFLDVLVTKIDQYGERYRALPEDRRREKAARLQADLIRFVENGGGLMSIHGGIVIFNNSLPFTEMVGGNFAFHPAQQRVTFEPVQPIHPLAAAFEGKPFSHIDEPYIFSGPYAKKDFRPLLVMDSSKITHKDMSKITGDIHYVAWIRAHGKGRVFYASPSHNAQSFEDPRLLKFFLDGLQYTLGDLPADATPLLPR